MLDGDSWLIGLINERKKSTEGRELRVLELGSGTGLGGICMAKLLEAERNEELMSDLTSSLVMSDICTKSLDTISTNVKKAGNLTNVDRISLVELEWGKHDSEWARQNQGTFDLIIASDVVYLPECVDPLLHSIKHFLKPISGKCLLVNNLVRIEAFLGQI